jgi:hypothetical protein
MERAILNPRNADYTSKWISISKRRSVGYEERAARYLGDITGAGDMELEGSREYGFFGWKEFRRNRKDLLAELARAKDYNASRPVQSEHGNAGEAVLRKWLSAFLPARYRVTSGYIIPDVVVPEYTLSHFDVIVYDAINSPVLWVDGDYDTSDQGRRMAIPAKHVRAVLEVKASLRSDTARDAVTKLGQLNRLAAHLPNQFSCANFFYELDSKLIGSHNILNGLIPTTAIAGYWGGLVLHCGLDEEMTGIMELVPRPAKEEDAKDLLVPLARDLNSLGVHRDEKGNVVIAEQGAGVAGFAGPDGWHFSKCYGPTVYGPAFGLMLRWSHNGFAEFALDLLERLEGIPRTNRRTYIFGQVFDKIEVRRGEAQTEGKLS